MTRDEIGRLAQQAIEESPSETWTNEWLVRFVDLITQRVMAEHKDKVCPYVQGETAHWCLLAEKGQPLTNEQIELKMRLMLGEVSPAARDAFWAGVRWSERCHGVTG